MFLKRIFNIIPRSEFSRALDLFNSGYYRKALKSFEQLLESGVAGEGDDRATVELYACEAHVALSKEQMEKGNWKEAVREMERAVSLKPNFADLRYNLANLHLRLGEHTKAHENFRRSLEINPRFFKARVSLARALLESGDQEGALVELSIAEEICPKFSRDKFAGLIQALRVKGKDEMTDRLFHEVLEERPSSSQLSRELAIEAIQNSDYAEAVRELKKAIALQPDYPDLHNYLGIAYGNNGMMDDAIEEFEIALKINPHYMKARLNLALSLYESGRYAEAQGHIERALAAQPQNQLAMNLLAELNAVKGR